MLKFENLRCRQNVTDTDAAIYCKQWELIVSLHRGDTLVNVYDHLGFYRVIDSSYI